MGLNPDFPPSVLHGPLTHEWAQALVTQAIDNGFNRRALTHAYRRICLYAFQHGENDACIPGFEHRRPLFKLMYLFGQYCRLQKMGGVPPDAPYFTPDQVHALGHLVDSCAPRPWHPPHPKTK
jgi:hypothetical protein